MVVILFKIYLDAYIYGRSNKETPEWFREGGAGGGGVKKGSSLTETFLPRHSSGFKSFQV